MTLRKKINFVKIVSMIIIVCIFSTSFMPVVTPTNPTATGTFNAPVSVLRVGLSFDAGALPSANLQNAAGFGSGFEFGFFDSNRNFVPIGAYTNIERISMLMSRNMVWHPGEGPGAGQYREGTAGNVVVGAFHIRFDTAHQTYQDARSIADTLVYSASFVSYLNGSFFVNIGHFTTRDDATSAKNEMGLSAIADVITGSDRAITVVRTTTNEIIFKFDYNSGRTLAVRPIATDGVSPETWFAGFRYHGAFQYERRGGGLITVVNFVCVEEYVKGVVPYEMSPSWHIEALKAQAVAARTYGLIYLNRHSSHGFDVCTTEHCQVYRGRNNATAHTDRSVIETSGLVMTHSGRLAAAYYASSHGGASENVENVWLTPLPHLRAVIDPFEASIAHRIPGYNWTLNFTQAEITHRLRDRTSFNGATIVSMEAEYSEVGNVIAIVFRDVNGVPFRLRGRDNLSRVLGVRSIRFNIGGTLWTNPEHGGVIYANDPARPISASGFYSIDGYGISTPIPAGPMLAVDSMGNIAPVQREGGAAAPTTSGIVGITNGVTVHGAGWGHNVGMSQWGALAQAELYGRSFRQILQFYFTGVEIQ